MTRGVRGLRAHVAGVDRAFILLWIYVFCLFTQCDRNNMLKDAHVYFVRFMTIFMNQKSQVKSHTGLFNSAVFIAFFLDNEETETGGNYK